MIDHVCEMADYCDWHEAIDWVETDLPLGEYDWTLAQRGTPVDGWDEISASLVRWDRLPFDVTEYLGNRPPEYLYLVVDGFVWELQSPEQLAELMEVME